MSWEEIGRAEAEAETVGKEALILEAGVLRFETESHRILMIPDGIGGFTCYRRPLATSGGPAYSAGKEKL